MEFKLNFEIPKSELLLTHKDSIVLIGSCFSDEMAGNCLNSGFNNESNTFGTLFHPTAIANVLNASINRENQINLFKRDNLYFSWDSAAKVYGSTEYELKSNVLALRESFRDKLLNAKLLIVTFGTSWGYRHNSLNSIVGNCHKAPSSEFERELSGSAELYEQWSDLLLRLKKFNPSLKIVFTVSPVRHAKDGLIENNRSKARLIELVHSLCEVENVSYFPSFEILIDELRGYRFYAEDLVHPNKLAIEYIWNKFSEAFFNDDTRKLIEEVRSIKTALAHKSLHPDSVVNQERLLAIEKKKAEFLGKHPEVCWG